MELRNLTSNWTYQDFENQQELSSIKQRNLSKTVKIAVTVISILAIVVVMFHKKESKIEFSKYQKTMNQIYKETFSGNNQKINFSKYQKTMNQIY